jgi:hypothetical protein
VLSSVNNGSRASWRILLGYSSSSQRKSTDPTVLIDLSLKALRQLGGEYIDGLGLIILDLVVQSVKVRLCAEAVDDARTEYYPEAAVGRTCSENLWSKLWDTERSNLHLMSEIICGEK